jgi:tetratricopeptide (TPR) repeat protein
MERALVLDPRNGQFALSLSWTYRRLRRYNEAKRVVDNFLAWQKDDLGFQLLRTEIQFEEKADLTPMKDFLSRHLPPAADRDLVLTYRLVVAYFARDYRTVEKVISEQGPWDKTHGFNTPREYMEGFCARALGERDRATAAFLRARERAAAPVATNPDDAKALMVLAKIDAKLGRKEQAMEEAERAVTLLPISVDTYDGPQLLVRLGQVYTEVGEIDRAVEVLQRAAALPAGLAYGILQLDAEFDPLRGDSRFQGIIVSVAPGQRR